MPCQPFCQQRRPMKKIPEKEICGIIITLTQTIVCFLLSCINWLVFGSFQLNLSFHVACNFSIAFPQKLMTPTKIMSLMFFFGNQLIPNMMNCNCATFQEIGRILQRISSVVNPLSANYTQTIRRQQPTNCLSVWRFCGVGGLRVKVLLALRLCFEIVSFEAWYSPQLKKIINCSKFILQISSLRFFHKKLLNISHANCSKIVSNFAMHSRLLVATFILNQMRLVWTFVFVKFFLISKK